MTARERLPATPDEYDAQDDFAKSLELGYRTIRERMAKGGPAWEPANGRPLYRLTLRPERGVDAVRALRALLKVCLRRFGLRCTSIDEVRQ